MKRRIINNVGMTLPELILAVFMLTAFTGITVMVTQFTSRFFQPLNQNQEVVEDSVSTEELSDMLSDNYQISNTMNSIIEIFSEPGIDKEFILGLSCTSLPSSEWKIPSINSNAIPKSYKICIKPTSLTESTYPKLVNGTGKPGIYIIYSKPVNGVSFNAIPIRRIFCRPKPFCKL